MSIKVLKSGKFQVTIRDANKRLVRRAFRLESDAQKFQNQSREEINLGQFIRPVKETVAERCDAWLKRKKESNGYRFGTLQGYETHIEKYIKPELGGMRIQAVTILNCEEAALKWNARTSANTANMALKTLTGIFAEAQRHGVLRENVAEKAQRIKIDTESEDDGEIQPEDIYTEEQLGKLINATEPGTLDRILIWLGGFCGLRIGEILGFSWAAVNLKDAATPKIRVIKNLVPEEKDKADFPGYGDTGRTLKDPKKKSRRTLTAPHELVHDLKLWKLKCPASRPRIWERGEPLAQQLIMVTVEGKPLQKKAAQALLDMAADRAGVDRRTLHRLRHTFASLQLDRGVSLPRVSRMLGHRDTTITSRTYGHWIDQETTAIQDLASSVLAHGRRKKVNKK